MLGGDDMKYRQAGPTYVKLKGDAAITFLKALFLGENKYNPKKEAKKAKKQLLAQGYRV